MNVKGSIRSGVLALWAGVVSSIVLALTTPVGDVAVAALKVGTEYVVSVFRGSNTVALTIAGLAGGVLWHFASRVARRINRPFRLQWNAHGVNWPVSIAADRSEVTVGSPTCQKCGAGVVWNWQDESFANIYDIRSQGWIFRCSACAWQYVASVHPERNPAELIEVAVEGLISSGATNEAIAARGRQPTGD